MKFVHELLGFIALSAPVLVLVGLAVLGVLGGTALARRFRTRAVRATVWVTTFLLVLLLPFADEVAGKIYLSRLCATQAVAKVLGTVILPSEYWNEKGEPKFLNEKGGLDYDFWKTRIDRTQSEVKPISSLLAINKHTHRLINRSTGASLGEITTFRHWGGWLRRNLSLHNSADSCDFMRDRDFGQKFYGSMFRPAPAVK